jgi:hypothetical protein
LVWLRFVAKQAGRCHVKLESTGVVRAVERHDVHRLDATDRLTAIVVLVTP